MPWSDGKIRELKKQSTSIYEGLELSHRGWSGSGTWRAPAAVWGAREPPTRLPVTSVQICSARSPQSPSSKKPLDLSEAHNILCVSLCPKWGSLHMPPWVVTLVPTLGPVHIMFSVLGFPLLICAGIIPSLRSSSSFCCKNRWQAELLISSLWLSLYLIHLFIHSVDLCCASTRCQPWGQKLFFNLQTQADGWSQNLSLTRGDHWHPGSKFHGTKGRTEHSDLIPNYWFWFFWAFVVDNNCASAS
jgi:hypothetical protein